MRIVSVCLSRCDGRFSFRRDESDRRIVDTFFGFVVVLLDGTFGGVLFRFGRRLLVAGHGPTLI